MFGNPVHEHDAVVPLVFLDWPPPAGDLQEERTECLDRRNNRIRGDVFEKGCRVETPYRPRPA